MRLHRRAIGLIAPTLVIGAMAALPAAAHPGPKAPPDHGAKPGTPATTPPGPGSPGPGTSGSSGSSAGNSSTGGSSGSTDSASGTSSNSDAAVCSAILPPGYAHCNAHVRTDANARGHSPAQPGARKTAPNVLGNNGAYDPRFLESAYNDPAYSWGSNGYYNGTGYGNRLVAIVDAYHDPSALSDLSAYRGFFHLPTCTTTAISGGKAVAGSSCNFYQVNQSGQEGSYPSVDSGWAQEISLDVDMVSAMCPNCSILLVEANDSTIASLGASVQEAVALGATVVSNSYGSGEYSSEVSDATSYYSPPGVAVLASSGDSGYGVEFPAASPSVTAVGGTSLQQANSSGTRSATESAWSGAGSGCSKYEPQPSYQTSLGLTGCGKRMVADVSADADPNTAVWVVYGNTWYMFGGTSVASPIMASVYALAGQTGGGSSAPQSWPYLNTSALYDVTTGSNGNCSPSYLCHGATGYDGPTGLGTPNGTTDFTGVAPQPTAPSAPQNLQATAGNASVALSWQPPQTTGGLAITYTVYRSTGPGAAVDPSSSGTTALVSSFGGTTYTDTAVTNGTTYNYAVVAHNTQGDSPLSSPASATPAQLVPGQITNLKASTSRTTGVTLTWSVPSNASTSYYLYRATSSNGLSSPTVLSATCGTTNRGATCTWNDKSGTVHNTTYYYQVAATNGSVTGPKSNTAQARAR